MHNSQLSSRNTLLSAFTTVLTFTHIYVVCNNDRDEHHNKNNMSNSALISCKLDVSLFIHIYLHIQLLNLAK